MILEERMMMREKKAHQMEELQKKLDKAVENYSFRPQIEAD